MAAENSGSLNFNVEARKTGKHFNRANRKVKKIPGVIYGPKVDNFNVVVDELFIQKHRSQKFEASIFKTESSDSKLGNINVMLKKIDYHPVSGRPVHVDFYALDMSQKVKVKVALKLVGEPIGCKEDGGVMQVILHEIEMECSPLDIPNEIVVDVSQIEINSSMHVSDMTFPANVEVITAGDRTAVSVSQPKEEKAADPSEAGPAAEGDAAATPAADAPKK